MPYTSPSLALPHAVAPPPEAADQGVPWHYGDPLREQRALVDARGVVDQSHLAVLAVSGGDRRSWLNALTSAQLLDLSGSASALILDPHGHVEYELHLIDDGGQTWIITEPDAGEGLRDYLDRMRFAADVEVRDASSERAVVWVPRREVDPERPTWLIPADYAGTGTTPAGSDRGGDASRYIGTRPGLLVGSQVLVDRDQLSAYLADAGEPAAGTWALEALRVAAGVPRPGLETDHRTIPHEVGWVGPAVHLAKGCYRGQETVARVHNMGRPPRRLVLLHLDGSDSHLPAHGNEVVFAERVVGTVGTAAQHFELGPVATAVLKRNVPDGASVLVAGTPASVQWVVQA